MAFARGPVVVKDGLVLWLDAANQRSYPGSGTIWRDMTGSVASGSLVNGPTFSSADKGSIAFDGSNDRVDIELVNPLRINSAATSSIEYQWTVQLYFKTNAIYDGTNTVRHSLFSFFGNNFSGEGFRYWSFEIWGNSFYATFNGDGTNFTQGGVSATANNVYDIIYSDKFRFITATVQGNNIRIYQNDLIEVFNRNSIYSMSSKYLSLGTRNSNYLSGNIAFFSLYNKVLSPQEILQNYNATKGRYGL